jgi:antitoxin component YwqK of YwqJK toxin-antitoxin module
MKKEDEFQRERGYWVNGQKRCEIPYVNGRLHGIGTCWRENGKKSSEYKYVNGQSHGIQMRWYTNGQKWMECPWVNGQRHGIDTWWYSNGSLRYIEKWNQGQRVVAFNFYESEVPEGKMPEIDILTKEFKLL